MDCDGSELKFLLRLLDDENPTVREAVKRRLAAFGPELVDAIDRVAPEIPLSVREEAIALQRIQEEDTFRSNWVKWLQEPSGLEKLERGHCLLSNHFASPDARTVAIPAQLDELADCYADNYKLADFRNLANYLFSPGMFQGDTERYYHPNNSILGEVLMRKRGNPISLASVYMLVGHRLGLEVGGCNYPAHFLARAVCRRDEKLYLVDCFNGGRIISAEDLIQHHPLASHEVSGVVLEECGAEAIIGRVMRNLEAAFGQNNLLEEEAFLESLERPNGGAAN